MTDPFLSLRIKGLGELRDQLKALPGKTRARIAKKALKEAAELIRQEVVARTPRKDGFLQASIKTKVSVTAKREQAQITAGDARAWYAHLIEYGFVHTGHGRQKSDRKPTSRGRVEGKAFMRGSAEAKFEPTVDVFEKTVIETLENEIGKAGK